MVPLKDSTDIELSEGDLFATLPESRTFKVSIATNVKKRPDNDKKRKSAPASIPYVGSTDGRIKRPASQNESLPLGSASRHPPLLSEEYGGVV
jgi:hypothetical protein